MGSKTNDKAPVEQKKAASARKKSASPKKTTISGPKRKPNQLKEREEYLKSIGFNWIEGNNAWTSPHHTIQVSKDQLKEMTDHEMPKAEYFKKRGEFSHELFDAICETIATSSQSTRSTCVAFGTSSTSFYRWLQIDQRDGSYGGTLRDTYARAKEDQVEYLIDEMLEIADDSSDDALRTKSVKNADGSFMTLVEENKEFVNRSKLRLDTRKFIASKLKPKKYGDKLDLTTDGEKISQIAVFQLPDNGRDKK